MTRTAAAALLTTALIVPVFATSASAQPPAGAPAAQGRGGTPPPPQNLQVLPKDIPRADLITAMRTFTQGLGVECNYCHVDQPARDFASDAKQTKKTARVMMQLVTHANEMIAGGVGKAPAEVVKVQCFTCHRGQAIPDNPPPPPPAPPAPAPGH